MVSFRRARIRSPHAGRFKSALGHFQQNLPALRRADIKRSSTLEAELLYHTGETARAITAATAALPLAAKDDECAARLTYILAMTAFESGDYPSSLKLIHRCLSIAKASSNRALIAQAHLGLFRVCAESVSPAVSVVSSVRKAVANSGTCTRSWILDCTSLAQRRHAIVCRRLGVIWLRRTGYSLQPQIHGCREECTWAYPLSRRFAVRHWRQSSTPAGPLSPHLCRDTAELTLVDG